VIEALRQFKGVPGRMERIDLGQPFTAIVDFAHAPNALQRAVETVRSLTNGRIIAVFGCAGQRDVEKRTMMGYIAAELADITIITAEDPRTETLADIIDVTAQAMLAKGAVERPSFDQSPVFMRVPDRGRAIYTAIQLAQPGDIVIALGKGHEQSMCFGTVEYLWDDREAMRAALSGSPLLTLPTAQKS
jgi:UDP-N-acetylmuramoyl-L-alanyl-D-glutamate--2,6-diaminopimelate ligase